ncbi:MAG: SDR family NAD(P)-dependent oxidoreductase [Arenicella sp.]|nr:SDR family NAD(P)-dependent oxidoreductase [Arenicella sp.]
MKNVILILFIILSLPNVQAKNIELKGKAVLVTGASSGIGRSIAETLASKGAFVYAGARKQKDIDQLSQIKNIMGIRLDVTKPNEIVAAVDLVKKEGRGLYGLVNNAGVFFHAPLIEVAESELQFMMDVNVFGPYRVTKAFAPLIIESRGRISNISSIAGIAAGPMFGPYAMSKFAIEAFSESLSHEMRKFDVQVSVVEPGNFKSNIMKNMHKRLALMEAEDIPTSYKEEYKALSGFTAIDRSHHRDPVAVANAVVQAFSSAQPKLRYMVTPTQAEANMTLRAAMAKVVQLNSDHEFSVDRKTLISTLDAASQ